MLAIFVDSVFVDNVFVCREDTCRLVNSVLKLIDEAYRVPEEIVSVISELV